MIDATDLGPARSDPRLGRPPSGPGPDRAARLAAYARARDWLDVALVRPGKRRWDPEGKVARARAFYAALGDRQRAFPAVQVAGTSGKGTVATLVAHGLEAAGLRAGLHTSPYLQAWTEKLWVTGRLACPLEFAAAADAVRAVADEAAREPDGPASVHGLAALGVTWELFARAGLDLAVVETGVGGRFDLVQGLDRRLVVVTDLGLDHQDVLGATLEEIAWHKAGALEPGAPAVVVRGPGAEVVAREAALRGVPVRWAEPEQVVTRAWPLPGGRLGAHLRLPTLGEVEVDLPLAAPFHLRNAAVAAVALDHLAEAGWPVDAGAVARGLARARVPGRLEWLAPVGPGDPPMLLDGAHSAPKLAALAAALDGALADAPARGARAVVLAAVTGARDAGPLVEALGPRAAPLVATAPRLVGKDVLAPAALERAARAAGVEAEAEPDPDAALERALTLARARGLPVVVTGSLYLVGHARARFVPTDEVVLQRTPWPTTASARATSGPASS